MPVTKQWLARRALALLSAWSGIPTEALRVPAEAGWICGIPKPRGATLRIILRVALAGRAAGAPSVLSSNRAKRSAGAVT